jgi:hypothetical protein
MGSIRLRLGQESDDTVKNIACGRLFEMGSCVALFESVQVAANLIGKRTIFPVKWLPNTPICVSNSCM